MAHEPTTQETSYLEEETTLYLAFELSKSKWRVRCSRGGQRAFEDTVKANGEPELLAFLARARAKLGAPEGCRMVSCYEAGRDGFWVHRFLERLGIENVVVDAASIKVSRHKRRPKNDRIDARMLLNHLIRSCRGDDDVWRVVRVPTERDEDDRRMHRELERLKKERTQHRARIQSLFATQGVELKADVMAYLRALDRVKIWNGQPLPPSLKAELDRERSRLEMVDTQIASIQKEQRESVKKPVDAKIEKVAKLAKARGIGIDSSWLLVMELFGWRDFRNRREVGGSVGLGGTPYDSGQMDREQGISKTGNARVRARLIELAWLWLRYQPQSDLTVWFNKRFGEGSKRAKRVGIVAVARRLLVELWHFVEHDVVPKGAIITPR